jgi:F-type H+-transporting ATPase subunit epsilon
MADKRVHLQIITPSGVKIKEDVDMVIMRAITGDMGILPGHEAMSAILDVGVLRAITDGHENYLAVFGGLAEVRDDTLTIITSLAETPDEISRARAEADKEKAERNLQEGITDTSDVYHGQARIRRSMVRIEVSSYPIISSRSGEDE